MKSVVNTHYGADGGISFFALMPLAACAPRCTLGLRKKPGRQNHPPDGFATPFKSLHLYIPREGIPTGYPLLVQMEGFEPSSFRRRILSPLCMPFHHICSLLIIHRRSVQVNINSRLLFFKGIQTRRHFPRSASVIKSRGRAGCRRNILPAAGMARAGAYRLWAFSNDPASTAHVVCAYIMIIPRFLPRARQKSWASPNFYIKIL